MSLIDALHDGNLDGVKAELARDPSLANTHSEEGVPVLRLAVYFSQPEAVAALKAAGAIADLHTAAALGDPLPAGDIHSYSSDGWTPLHLAAFFGRPEAARALIAAGADVKARSTNQLANLPIHAAAAGKHSIIVEMLVKAGSPVNEPQHGGFVPLHSAAQNGDIATAKILMAAGANPRITAGAGKSAVDLAREKGYDELAAMLEA